MNSATSTESQSLSGNGSAAPAADAGLEPWQFFTLAGLIGATVVVFLSEGQGPAAILVLSFVIFAAAAVGATAWRALSPLTGKDGPAGPQILGGRTRAAIEREKTLVLRAIKDLEFDRAMGKISEKDFAEMDARLRGRAAGLMRQLDAGTGYREDIQREIDKRVGSRKIDRPSPSPPSAPAAAPTTKICLSCCTVNDTDARFCKGCGYQMGNW